MGEAVGPEGLDGPIHYVLDGEGGGRFEDRQLGEYALIVSGVEVPGGLDDQGADVCQGDPRVGDPSLDDSLIGEQPSGHPAVEGAVAEKLEGPLADPMRRMQ